MLKSTLIVAALAAIGIAPWAMPAHADEPSEEDIVLQRQWEVQDRMEQSSTPPETVAERAPERDDVMAVEEVRAAEPEEALDQDKPRADGEASEQLRYVGEDELGRYPD